MKNIKENVASGLSLKGVYHIQKAKIQTEEEWAQHDKIVELRDAGLPFQHEVEELNRMCDTEEHTIDNLIPTVARAMIANNIYSATPDNTIKITHFAVGTDTTAPVNGNTTLGTEFFRNTISSIDQGTSTNIVVASAFMQASEAVGTLTEAGLFSDATITPDSGILFSHVLIKELAGGIPKSSSETLTLNWNLSLI